MRIFLVAPANTASNHLGPEIIVLCPPMRSLKASQKGLLKININLMQRPMDLA
jgi:hypothetical protein